MADYTSEIASLETVINAAASRVSSDGHTVDIDLEAARKRLSELKALDSSAIAHKMTRPRIWRMKLNNTFG